MILMAAMLAIGAGPALAAVKELGGCGNARHAQSMALRLGHDVQITVGMEAIGVHQGVSSPDLDRIEIPYAHWVAADPTGQRFVIRSGKTLHLYTFSDLRRIARKRIKTLKDDPLTAWHWVPGSDELLAAARDRKARSRLLRINVVTGASSSAPLDLPAAPQGGAFNREGTLMAIAAADGSVRVHATGDAALLHAYRPHGSSDWNRYGLAFHPTRPLLASSDGEELVFFDLDAGGIERRPEAAAGTFLQFIAEGRFLIVGEQYDLILADPEGRVLERRGPPGDDYYREFHVDEALRKVFALGHEFICWRTFERWPD